MAKAKAIAMQHNIDLAMISLKDPNEKRLSIKTSREDVGIRSQKFQIYHRYIFLVMQECFGVSVVIFGSSKFCLIGEETDVLICKELFPWLEDVFYSTYYKAKKAGMVVSCAADKRGIYYGLYIGITESNKREEAAAKQKVDANAYALVVRSKEDAIQQRLSEEFPRLQNSKSRATDINPFAAAHGRKEGQKIRLDQMGNNSHSQLR